MTHDYLMVIDSSLPGHTAERVRRQWDYRVSLAVGKAATSRLRVRYEHQDVRLRDRHCRQSEPAYYGCYWNYFRVYLPGAADRVRMPPVPLHEGSEKLIWGYADADSRSLIRNVPVGLARLTEVGGYIAVEPGSTAILPLEYQLPWELVRPVARKTFEYRLLVQKQAGMDRDQVSVAVELPLGTRLLQARPTPKAQQGRWIAFDFLLDSDKEVSVVFEVSKE